MGLGTLGFVKHRAVKGAREGVGTPRAAHPCPLWPQSLCRAGIPSISLKPQTRCIPALCPYCPAQFLFLVLT